MDGGTTGLQVREQSVKIDTSTQKPQVCCEAEGHQALKSEICYLMPLRSFLPQLLQLQLPFCKRFGHASALTTMPCCREALSCFSRQLLILDARIYCRTLRNCCWACRRRTFSKQTTRAVVQCIPVAAVPVSEETAATQMAQARTAAGCVLEAAALARER